MLPTLTRASFALLLLLALPASLALGHGDVSPPPPPEPPMPPHKQPIPWTPPPPPPPETPRDLDPNTPNDPPPPPDSERPPTGGPETPPELPDFREKLRPKVPGSPERRVRRGAGDTSWRQWWGYNRSDLVGLRRALRESGTVTGRPDGELVDPLGPHRSEVVTALREIVRGDGERKVRASALVALGRMGAGEDAVAMVGILRDARENAEVHEAAAVGLMLLPEIGGGDTRDATRSWLERVIARPDQLDGRARGLALVAAGVRAREEPMLAMHLIGRSTAQGVDSEEAANLVWALGLSRDPMAIPELRQAALEGKLGLEKLTDTGRSHAASALGRSGDPTALTALAAVLGSRSAGLDTKRAAALAIARLLRETPTGTPPDAEARVRAGRVLLRAFEKESEPLLRAFCAIALGGASPPLGAAELMQAIDHGGNAALKPYCALALAIGARRLDADSGDRIRTFLLDELRKSNDPDLGAALSIACGLARAADAESELLDRLRHTSLPAATRGAAAEGLGLLRSRSPEAGKALESMLDSEKSPELLEHVVVALGLMGRRGVARKLATMVSETESALVQGRLILALGHIGHVEAVAPLLEALRDKSARTLVREFAAAALGLMGDRRPDDLLFSLEADFNYLATSATTNELIRLY